MCGIGGILRTDGQPIPEEWLDMIDARIAWRGPDGHGRFRDRVEIDDANAPDGKRVVEVAFVHRRLSIIDHEGGHQPMVSERGRNDSEGLVAVVFNGCIYNHRELRKELESKGHTFVTDHSDTEVLIHGWREWGVKIIQHLEGMYAFAIWDRAATQLFLARDEFGEKPLYSRWLGSDSPGCVFASQAEAVDRVASEFMDCVPLRFSVWLSSYLQLGYGYSHSSPYQWVENIGPDGFLVINPQGVGGEYGPDYADHENTIRSEIIEGLLEQAVQRRLEADVPLACFLSGGIDSSLVALFAKKHKPDLQSFCVKFDDPRYDESQFANSVATRIGTNHRTLQVAREPAKDLLFLICTLGQPFGDSSLLPTYWLSKAVQEHARVALSGDGGDELFMGYERYAMVNVLHRMHKLIRILPLNILLRANRKSRLHKLGRLAEMAGDYSRLGPLSTESIFTQREISALLGEQMRNPPNSHPGTWVGDSARQVLRMDDVNDYLPSDLLTKVDTASMACGLEVRCPFLDRDLARAALSMPIDQLMPRGQRKGLLRNIARKYLPKEIVDRPKMGFAIPIGEWFRNDDLPHKGSGMKTLLLDHLNSTEPFGPIHLNRKAVQRFIDEHMSGKRDHGQKLFTLLTLSIWARAFAKSATATSSADA